MLLLLLSHHQHLVAGAVLGQRRKKDDDRTEAAKAAAAAAAVGNGADDDDDEQPPSASSETEVPPTEGVAAAAASEQQPDATTRSQQPQPQPQPPTLIEAEARTARELSSAVKTLRADLSTCADRVSAIEGGFQDLYSVHLGNVHALRRCKEGMLPLPLPPTSSEELEEPEHAGGGDGDGDGDGLDGDGDDIDDGLDGIVNPALVSQARSHVSEKKRRERDEALAEKHRIVILDLERRVETLERREKAWERTISELTSRRDLLERREGAWERTIGELMDEIDDRERREGMGEERRVEMEGRIGMLSRIATEERFGPGPHYVSVTVLLEEDDPSSRREIVLQLAPLEIMPHSVHLFLSQIAGGYWSRGTPAIVLNAEHVLQACPHPCLEGVDLGGSSTGYPYDDMKRDGGMDVVSFQEYSPEYPHRKYTIGFAGRPHSGPEFYINLMDNTLDHGMVAERRMMMDPDVYEAWAEEAFGFGGPDEADERAMEPYPCFGKVIEGFEVVDEIAMGTTRALLPRREGEEEGAVVLDDNILLRPVKIASVTILKDYSPSEGGEKDLGSGSGSGSGSATDEL